MTGTKVEGALSAARAEVAASKKVQQQLQKTVKLLQTQNLKLTQENNSLVINIGRVNTALMDLKKKVRVDSRVKPGR